jgi:hypothetical protein
MPVRPPIRSLPSSKSRKPGRNHLRRTIQPNLPRKSRPATQAPRRRHPTPIRTPSLNPTPNPQPRPRSGRPRSRRPRRRRPRHLVRWTPARTSPCRTSPCRNSPCWNRRARRTPDPTSRRRQTRLPRRTPPLWIRPRRTRLRRPRPPRRDRPFRRDPSRFPLLPNRSRRTTRHLRPRRHGLPRDQPCRLPSPWAEPSHPSLSHARNPRRLPLRRKLSLRMLPRRRF